MIVERDPLSLFLKLAPSPAFRSLTPRQRAAMAGPARFRAWLAGRRAGKSYAAAEWLLGGSPGQISIYCSRTLKSAKAIMIAAFRELNAKYRLNLDIRSSTGTITEPNGHVIQFYGLRDTGAADLMRGLSKLRRVVIDEGGAFTDELLKYSVESVIQPMLLDLRGEMVLCGTPGPIPKGYFYDITGNPGLSRPTPGRWPVHHWTFRDNPHVPAELVLEEALSANGWTEQHATFMREYGAVWCEDAESIVYQYFGERWATPPQSGVTKMGIDFGVNDSTTWVVGRQSHDTKPHVFVCEAVARSGLDLPEIAMITRQLREKWSVNTIKADEGALGKGYANHLRGQYRLPLEAAKKQDKKARIEGVRGRLAAHTLQLCAGAEPLYNEWRTLCWNDVRDDHHERLDDDLSDACLYMCEEFSAWEHPVAPPAPALDPNQAIKARVIEMHRRGRIGNL